MMGHYALVQIDKTNCLIGMIGAATAPDVCILYTALVRYGSRVLQGNV